MVLCVNTAHTHRQRARGPQRVASGPAWQREAKKKKTASSSLDLQLVARWEQSELLAYSVQRLLVMGGAGLETVTLPGLFLFLFYFLHHLQTASSISRSSG